MPYINIRTTGQALSPSQFAELVSQTTTLMATIMGKKAELTSVRVEEGPATAWGIGGTLIGETGGRAAHMDIKVTAGTNSDDEKADMVKAGHRMLTDVLGTLPEATYVVIHDLPGENWGYAGETQAARAAA